MNSKALSWSCGLFCAGLLALCAVPRAQAADNASGADAFPALAGKRGVWVNLSEDLLADFAKHDIKPVIKFKYDSTNGAGICGMLADRTIVDGPWLVVQGRGLWKHAAAGTDWQRIDGGKYDGFYENVGPDIDPEGRGICLFSIQGSTIDSTCAMTRDGGKTWTALSTDQAGFGYDAGAVDWAGGGKTILARKHHSADLVLSRDGGKSWTTLAKGEARNVVLVTGVIGADVLLKGMSGGNGSNGLYRSMDGGTNWARVADCSFSNRGHVVVFRGAAYVTCTKGILASRDQGAHWALPGDECAGFLGPVMFGKDETHLMVYGKKGFFESEDGGKTWAVAVPFGDDPAMRTGRFEYGVWNPADDSFYITHIGGQAYGYRR